MRMCAALAVLLIATSCSVVSPARISQEPRSRHVLVMGLDGVRPDALRAARTPRLDALAQGGTVSWDSIAGGGAASGDVTQQATSSGPGWSSVLTGVWANKHGVRDNSFEGHDLETFPHAFVRIRDALPDAYLASIVHWAPINEQLLRPYPGAASFLAETETDAAVVAIAVEQLRAFTPDVLFLHFDDVDHAGHAHGYSSSVPEYLAAIEQVDRQLGQVLEALAHRPERSQEDWLILLTTDHGGSGTGHGGQSADERRIWVIAHGAAVLPREVSPGPGHTVIARSLFEHLGLDCPPSWGLVDLASFTDD